MYTSTEAVTLISVTILKVSATIALVIQLVVADRELAVPMTCKGYISELIVQGVELMPKEKKSRNNEIPVVAIPPPHC